MARSRGKQDEVATTGHVPLATILKTKIQVPEIVPGLVERSRLVDRLKQNPRRPLTLVAAPAGYGKTAAVMQWLQATGTRPAWLQLDERDGDLRSFVNLFVAAVELRFPDACPDTRALLQAVQMPSCSVLADALNNDLDAMEESFILVLEDYHLIADPSAHELLENLLRYPPRPLHLVLITRHDPPLSLAALRAHGWLVEIRQDDLRFSVPEVRAVLEQMAGITLSDTALAHLERKMEGWIVGLYLIGLLLRDQTDPEEFVLSLKGGSQQIHQYLSDEVIARQPAQVRDCLLEVSVVDRFCAPLAEALCIDAESIAARMTGKDFIEAARRANLFVIPLDAQGEWFRFHHLFQDLLRRQLESERSSQEISVLHARASEWFEGEGLIEHSIRHALKDGDPEDAAKIVERHRNAELSQERWYLIENWLALLPPEIKQRRAPLLLAHAWTLYFQWRIEEMCHTVGRVESLLADDTADEGLVAELDHFRGYLLLFLQGEGERARIRFKESRKRAPETHRLLTSESEALVCLARQTIGQGESAIASVEERLREVDSSDGATLSRLIGGQIFIHLLSGELAAAFRTSQQLQRVGKKSGNAYADAWSRYLQANCRFQSFQLDEALRGFVFAADWRCILNSAAAVDALAGLSLTHQMMQRTDGAQDTVRELAAFARESGNPVFVGVAEACQTRLALLRGDRQAAIRWARSHKTEPHVPSMLFWVEVPAITQVRALLTADRDEDFHRANELLATLQQGTARLHNNYQTIDILVLQSLSCERQGRGDEALTVLENALSLAEPGHWIRPFVEPGRRMADLLTRLREKTVRVPFVEQLLAAFPDDQDAVKRSASTVRKPPSAVQPETSEPNSASPADTQPLMNPLTSREMETLELLSQRLYDKEIAKAMSISVSTVNSHLKKIFRKLHVNNRRQAVLKGEELGLLKGE